MMAIRVVLLLAVAPALTAAFSVNQPVGRLSTNLFVGPLQKLTQPEKYNKVVEQTMAQKDFSREEAEKDYNAFLENPNNYALGKGEEFYSKLGYDSLMDGVVGEAEKRGDGDEVRERIENFKRKSQLKAYSVIFVVWGVFLYFKLQFDADPSNFPH